MANDYYCNYGGAKILFYYCMKKTIFACFCINAMNVINIIGKMIRIFVNPLRNWRSEELASIRIKDLHGKVFPLLMVAFFAIVLFGSAMNHIPEVGFAMVLADALIRCSLFSVIYFLLSFIEYRLCRMYVDVNYTQSSLLLLETLLPFYLLYAFLSVFYYPALRFLWILVAYCIVIIYYGSVDFLKVQKDKSLIFIILSMLLILFYIVMSLTLDEIFKGVLLNG